MSKEAMTEVSLERRLLDMPYEILLEIFRKLPKNRSIEISRLSSKLRNVAGDTRLWKNVTLSYDAGIFAFEELYSEPWPVEGIDLQQAQINPPVSSKTDQLVKVTRLYLSLIKTNEVIMEAILAKYQCTELYLDCTNKTDNRDLIEEIAPKAISKLITLEVLGLRDTRCITEPNYSICTRCHLQLAPVLSNCKNLKTLCLRHVHFINEDLLGFVQSLPSSLEKLFLGYSFPDDDYFFELLTKSTPNLRELELSPREIGSPSLLKFQFLETLYITFSPVDSFGSSTCLKKYPALKTLIVYIGNGFRGMNYSNPDLEKLRTMLEPRGIVVKQIRRPEWWPNSQNGDLWKMSKAR